jgi:hypothetical protein
MDALAEKPPTQRPMAFRQMHPDQQNAFNEQAMGQVAGQSVGDMAAMGAVLAGLGLGGTALWSQLRNRSAKRQVKTANVIGDAFDAVQTVPNAISSGVGNFLGLGTGAHDTVSDYSKFTTPALLGTPLAIAAALKMRNQIKQTYPEQEGNPELEAAKAEYQAALQRKLMGKTAALAATEGVIEMLEKNASMLKQAWTWQSVAIPGEAALFGAGLGAGYYGFRKLDPQRIRAQAAQDAYRRQRIIKQPTVQVLPLRPGETSEQLSSMSDANNLVVPIGMPQEPAAAPPAKRVKSRVIDNREKAAAATGLSDEQINNFVTGWTQMSNLEKVACIGAAAADAGVLTGAELERARALEGWYMISHGYEKDAGALDWLKEKYNQVTSTAGQAMDPNSDLRKQIAGASELNSMKNSVLSTLKGAASNPITLGLLLSSIPLFATEHPFMGALALAAGLFGPQMWGYVNQNVIPQIKGMFQQQTPTPPPAADPAGPQQQQQLAGQQQSAAGQQGQGQAPPPPQSAAPAQAQPAPSGLQAGLDALTAGHPVLGAAAQGVASIAGAGSPPTPDVAPDSAADGKQVTPISTPPPPAAGGPPVGGGNTTPPPTQAGVSPLTNPNVQPNPLPQMGGQQPGAPAPQQGMPKLSPPPAPAPTSGTAILNKGMDASATGLLNGK